MQGAGHRLDGDARTFGDVVQGDSHWVTGWVNDYSSLPSAPSRVKLLTASRRRGAVLQDLIVKAKPDPGSIKIGHPGVGTTEHLTGERLGIRTGAKFLQIPYKGGAAASTALLGGEVDLLIDAGTVIRGRA
jgi:hypothetical protein